MNAKLEFPRRPGPGWTRAGLPDVPVFDHVSGVRVHTSGLTRVGGKTFSAAGLDESRILQRAICQQGWNRRRGAMVWALSKLNHE